MGLVLLIRQGVLGLTTVFSIIELAVSANLISQFLYIGVTNDPASALGLAVAVISAVTLPVMLVADIIRRGAFTSMIVVEITWLFILCILWVASAGTTTSRFNLYFPVGCISIYSIDIEICHEVQAIAAFAFLNFIIFLVYASALCVMAVIAATRGQSVWLSSVRESLSPLASPVQYPMTQHKQVVGTPASTV